MVTSPQVLNGTGSTPPTPAVPVMLEYNPTTDAVTVTPSTIAKGATICFKCSNGKVRVVFLSPFNEPWTELKDSEPRTVSVGGVFHFRCFFQQDEYSKEIESTTGGILDVQPHKP